MPNIKLTRQQRAPAITERILNGDTRTCISKDFGLSITTVTSDFNDFCKMLMDRWIQDNPQTPWPGNWNRYGKAENEKYPTAGDFYEIKKNKSFWLALIEKEKEQEKRTLAEKPLTAQSIKVLNFSTRTHSFLRRSNCVNAIGDLLQLSERDLRKIPNCGIASVLEIKGKLAQHGLFLQSEVKLDLLPGKEGITRHMNNTFVIVGQGEQASVILDGTFDAHELLALARYLKERS
jgi:Bacterial RNA polymerase, alpha chain C terminal domain